MYKTFPLKFPFCLVPPSSSLVDQDNAKLKRKNLISYEVKRYIMNENYEVNVSTQHPEMVIQMSVFCICTVLFVCLKTLLKFKT